MIVKKQFILLAIYILVCVVLGQISCKSGETNNNDNILAAMAHPDDETLISGSLAKPVDRGYDVIIIFVTSGDDGHDVSGQNLSGLQLAEIREQEADKSLQAIDKLHPPVFPGKMAQYCL